VGILLVKLHFFEMPKSTGFIYLGKFSLHEWGLHVWLHGVINNVIFPQEVVARAAAEVFNVMLHENRLSKNEHVLVFSYFDEIVHSTQISHIDFPRLHIPETDLPGIWTRLAKAPREPPFLFVEMEFNKDDTTVHRCVTQMKTGFEDYLKVMSTIRVTSFAPLVRYESRKAILQRL